MHKSLVPLRRGIKGEDGSIIGGFGVKTNALIHPYT
jgi:hypothetical protein